MVRINKKDWALAEELRKRRRRVKTKLPIFQHYVCAACGDALRFERVWRVEARNSYKYKVVCQQCASTWEEAHDKADDSNSDKAIYSSGCY